jgi:hypothetical protein
MDDVRNGLETRLQKVEAALRDSTLGRAGTNSAERAVAGGRKGKGQTDEVFVRKRIQITSFGNEEEAISFDEVWFSGDEEIIEKGRTKVEGIPLKDTVRATRKQ